MLSIQKMNESALECLGWPYKSPGTNDKNGIDCSGMFVKMYRDQGAKIYHGSNTIYHEYCSETGKITSEKQLCPGMAVFKLKAWTDADKGNKWYGKDPGNLSHIGYVLSTNPLQIIHASSVAGCVTIDTKLGKWARYGRLKDVDYGSEPIPTPEPSKPSKTMYTFAENGKPINLRAKPSLSAALIDKVPVNQTVIWIKDNGAGWAYIKWNDKHGWMMDCYLINEQSNPSEPDITPDPAQDNPVDETLTVWADNGMPVKLRQQPSTSCNIYERLPVGTEVELVKYGAEWTKVNYKQYKGWYMMTKFLSHG